MGRGADRWPLLRLALGETGRSVRAFLRRPHWRIPVPRRLVLSPQDLRTADPTVATDIYAGYFVLAGRAAATGGRSPFEIPPPSRAWAEELYGFGWLRHLRAADTALARSNARTLVEAFAGGRHVDRHLARRTGVTARRLMSLLNQAPLLLAGADHAFYRRLMRAIGRCVHGLARRIGGAPPYPRLQAAIALSYAGLCCEGFEGVLRRATRILSRELDRQILPDGGHASRDPQVLVDLLLDLLPLRQLYASRGLDTPPALVGAIDRMLPMIRLLRQDDGTLSHVNGMGPTRPDHLATILFYDDLRAQPIHHAPYSGYERLEAAGALLVCDVGPVPPADQSSEVHAGCLSFELSSGPQRIVVNCGAPRFPGEAVAQAVRATAAHSTAGLDGASSCRFLDRDGWWGRRLVAGWLLRRLGCIVLSGPTDVPTERGTRDGAQLLSAGHDGYRARFGIVHERRWQLAAAGDRLDGEDVFLRDPDAPGADEATIRFHLHPSVRADRVQGGRSIMLQLPDRETWQFEASSHDARIEESVFFASPDGMRRSEQIVVAVDLRRADRVRWRFERIARAPGAAPAGTSPVAGPL